MTLQADDIFGLLTVDVSVSIPDMTYNVYGVTLRSRTVLGTGNFAVTGPVVWNS